MLYLTTGSTAPVREAIQLGLLGELATPASGKRRVAGSSWGADNGCFNERTYPGDDRWFAWLTTLERDGCLFAVLPDVVADAEATLARSLPWVDPVRELGFPVAFVAQDGAVPEGLPWSRFDVLFVGGSTDWKLGPEAREIVGVAQMLGKWVHMGRVNSRKRVRYARSIGVDSVDGTYIAFAPNYNLPKVLSWMAERNDPRF